MDVTMTDTFLFFIFVCFPFIIFVLFLKLYRPDANIFLFNLLVKCTHIVIASTKRALGNVVYNKYDWISKLTVVADGPLIAFSLLFTSILKSCVT